MTTRGILLSALFLMLAVPASAGSGEKCSASTQVCLNHWSEMKNAAWVGLEYDMSTEGMMMVKAVTPDSPAAAAGFQVGDVMLALNGARMADKEAVKKAKGAWTPGQSVTYTVQRAGAEKQIAVTLAKTPDAVFASMVGRHMLENHVMAATAAADEKAAHSHDKK